MLFFTGKKKKMTLTPHKGVETVFLRGHQGWTKRQVADNNFNIRHSQENSITHGALRKLEKYLEKGSITSKS